MTWRYFLTRLTGLSAESRWMGALLADERGKREETDVVRLDGDAAEAWFAAL